ncbi:MAG: M16 family metallopeptidase [Gemmatimonadales bacterium]
MGHPSWVDGVQRRTLANGLTVLVQPDPDAPAVAVVTHVKAGFFDEPDRWQGISHVLEHMFFKGTPTRGVGQIATETKGLGGYLNAHTSYDATCYYVVLPGDRFEAAIDIQADALRHATIDADELARELKVIIEEAKRKLDTPSATAYETLHELLFDHHRIRRWRIGHEAALAGFTRADVAGYYRSRYVPDRVIVSIVGNVDVEAAFGAVERLYGDWAPAPGAVDRSPDEPWRRGVRARTLRGDVRQADLAVGWRGVAPLAPEAAALDVAAGVLSSGRGSWLYQALRQPGLVTSVGAYHYSPAEVGVFSVTADLAPGDLDRVVGVIAGLVNRLRETGPSEADLERVRTLLRAQWARRLESVDGRAMSFAASEALGGLGVLDDEYRRLLEADAETVRTAAARYLDPDSVAAVAYLPEGVGPELPAARLAVAFGAAKAAASTARLAPASLALGSPAAVSHRVESGVTVATAGRVDILVRRKSRAPLVTVGLYRRRSHDEGADTAGIGALAVRSTVRGAGPYDGPALSDAFEAFGGTLSAAVGADWFGVSGSVLAAHRDRAVRLLVEVLGAPRFDSGEVDRERHTLRDEAAQAADDMFRHPVQLALGAAFGPRSYGLPVRGTVASLEGLDAARAREWWAAEGAGRTTLVVAGQVDPEAAVDRLAGVVAGFDGAAAAAAMPTADWLGAGQEIVETRRKSQTAIAMAFPGPSRTDPDRHAVEVLAAVASGLGGRLFSALRDRRSLAYTVVMSSWQRARAGAVVTYIATSPEREAEARTAMLAELALLVERGVTEDEHQRAVSYLAGQALVQRQTTSAIAAEMVDAWLIGTGLAELADPGAPYRAVTRAAVQAAAQRYLVPDRRAEGIVRGGSAS